MKPSYLVQFLSRIAVIQDCRTINTYLRPPHCWSTAIDGAHSQQVFFHTYIHTSDGKSTKDNELNLFMNAIKLIVQPDLVLVYLEAFLWDLLPAKQSQDCSLRFMKTEIAFLQYWEGVDYSLIIMRRAKIPKKAKHEPQYKPRHVSQEKVQWILHNLR